MEYAYTVGITLGALLILVSGYVYAKSMDKSKISKVVLLFGVVLISLSFIQSVNIIGIADIVFGDANSRETSKIEQKIDIVEQKIDMLKKMLLVCTEKEIISDITGEQGEISKKKQYQDTYT